MTQDRQHIDDPGLAGKVAIVTGGGAAGDGIGNGEYDLVANGANLWSGEGTEPMSWPLDLRPQVTDVLPITVCEDDNGNHADCSGWDNNLGGLLLWTDLPSIPSTSATFSYPAGKTDCEQLGGSKRS